MSDTIIPPNEYAQKQTDLEGAKHEAFLMREGWASQPSRPAHPLQVESCRVVGKDTFYIFKPLLGGTS